MANERVRRNKATGRAGGRFVGIPDYVFRSPEFGLLSGWDLKLLVELAGGYNGFNNGNLSCAYRQLKERGWRSNSTLQASRQRLLANGWIVTTRHGGRRRCALYAITWAAIDACEGKGLEIGPEKTPRNWWQESKRVVAMRPNVVAMRTHQPAEVVTK